VLNFLLKVVTAPFDIIAGSLGLAGADDLSHIAFAAGSVELSPEGVVKLDALNRALQERPKL
jgi:cystathionine beta-lyase family protein involved in aluminum resistance